MTTLLLLPGLLWPNFAPPAPNPSAVEIAFDYSETDQVLRYLGGRTDDFSDLVGSASTEGVLKKVQGRDKKITMKDLTDSLQRARSGDKSGPDPFQWRAVFRNREQLEGLVKQIRSHEDEITSSLRSKLTSVLPIGTNIKAKVRFVVGSASAGWATDRGTLYIGLHHYGGDYQGIRMTLQHELFHNAQYAAYQTEETDTKRLSPRQKELFELSRYIFMEGTASYFANPEDFVPAGTFLNEVLPPQRENLDRMSEDFELLNLFLFRLSRDPKAKFEDFYPIGFDWSWKNPFYFVGMVMTQALVKANGEDYLRRCLNQNPVQFIADYVQLCHAKDAPASLPRLSSDSETIIRRLTASLPKPKKA